MTPLPVAPSLQQRALEIHARLCAAYGCPVPFFSDLDPLSELVSALLSHRTKNRDSARAFAELRRRFPTWEEVRDAPTAEVQAAIAPCTWPEAKAPRVQAVLKRVGELRGELSLDFLAEWPAASARAWLEAIPGVGPKTSAATLLFSRLRVAALPVDSHHHRVAERLRLIPPRTSLERAHELLADLLPEDWTAQEVYDHHEVLMFLGQRCCFPQSPACPRCPVNDLCPSRRAAAT